MKCRPDQLWGMWAIDPDVHARLVDLCLAHLPDVLARGQAAVDESDDGDGPRLPPYDNRAGVAVIDLSGPLTKYPTSFDPLTGGGSTVRAREALRAAVNDPAIHRVLFQVESPGGTVNGTKDLADAIRAADKLKPVYAHIDDVGSSGAYWIASAARRVTANANAQVGGIGAYTVLRDTSGVLDKQGIKLHVVSSGGHKGAGHPGTPVTDEQLKEIGVSVRDVADLFIAEVARGRNLSTEHVGKLADGRAFIAAKAKDHGLIDAVDSFDNVLTHLQNLPPTTARGAPIGGQTPPHAFAASRSQDMAFTAEQMARVKQLPGAADVTEQNAADFLIARCQQQQSAEADLRRDLAARDTEIGTLKARGVPAKADPTLAAGHVALALERIDLCVQREVLLPAQADVLKAYLSPAGGQPNVAAVTPEGKVLYPADVLAKVIELNAPKGLQNRAAGVQQMERQTPGAPEPSAADRAADEGFRIGQRFQSDRLSQMGGGGGGGGHQQQQK